MKTTFKKIFKVILVILELIVVIELCVSLKDIFPNWNMAGFNSGIMWCVYCALRGFNISFGKLFKFKVKLEIEETS